MATVWMYHLYERETKLVWGYGYLEGVVWEYFGKWCPEDSPAALHVQWRKHDDKNQLQTMERVLEISLNQRSLEQMETFVPNFENKLLATFLFKKMEASGSDELTEPA